MSDPTPADPTLAATPDQIRIPDDEILTVEQVTEGEFIDGDHTDSQI